MLGDYSDMPLPKKRKQTAVDLEDYENGSGEDDFSINGEQDDCKQLKDKQRREDKTNSTATQVGNTNDEGEEVTSRLSKRHTTKDTSDQRKSGQIGNNARRVSTRLRKKQRLS